MEKLKRNAKNSSKSEEKQERVNRRTRKKRKNILKDEMVNLKNNLISNNII